MKNLKYIILSIFVGAMAFSCEKSSLVNDSEDTLTGGATLAALVEVSDDTAGKLLGVPSSLDFETATVALAEFDLDLTVQFISGGENITGYEITKSLNGGTETTVASGALPLSVSYSTPEEFLDGLGVSESDLRIGDKITFKTKMITDTGDVLYANPSSGSFTITVNCSSKLAKTYDVAMNYVRASTSTDTWYYFTETIVELSPGAYRTAEVGPWIGGLGVGIPGFTFTDTCGSLEVPEQNLLEYYSNLVAGSGSVNGATGVLTIDYTICASDCRECYATYTPQP